MQIQDRAIDSVARLHHHHASPGQLIDIIGGPQQARLAGEIIVDLALIPDVIAAGEHVQAVAEQLIGELRRDAEAAGGVFGVGDGQIDFFGGDDVAQMAGNHAAPGGGENIANKKKIGQRDELSKERTTKPS